jgi:hypothetical protein
MKQEAKRTKGGDFPGRDQWVWRVFVFRRGMAGGQTALVSDYVTRPIPRQPATPASEIPFYHPILPDGDFVDPRGPHLIYMAPR